ncbi:MAG: transposase [Deltaproteobacteria bacterium]|nr:transposase [Deltaproteobacteria bacterium]
MNAKGIERIEMPMEEIQALLERVKAAVEPRDFETIEKIVESLISLTQLLKEKGATIKQLRKMLFGTQSERLRDILEQIGTGEPHRGQEGEGAEPGAEQQRGEAVEGPGDEGAKAKKKGHGRNGADAYTGAEQVRVEHPSLKPGDPCPDPACKGKVYRCDPLVLVRVVGDSPLRAQVVNIEQLRCNLCLTVYKACCPEEDFGADKYDESAASMIAILRYGTGMPFNRLESLQRSLGVPLPASTQWDIVERAAKLVAPAFEELVRQAAQGDVIHNDDTPMKILEYMGKRKRKADDG